MTYIDGPTDPKDPPPMPNCPVCGRRGCTQHDQDSGTDD